MKTDAFQLLYQKSYYEKNKAEISQKRKEKRLASFGDTKWIEYV